MNTRTGIVCISMFAAVSVAKTARADCNGAGFCTSQKNSGTGGGVTASTAGSGNAFAVYASAPNGFAVAGSSVTSTGVSGSSSSSNGGYFSSSTGTGVFASSGTYIAGDFSAALVGGTGIRAIGDTAAWLQGNVITTGTYYSTGSQTLIQHYSDARLKKNIKPLEGSLDQLLRLRGVTYEWKAPAEHGNEQGPQRGFIAQEVEKVIPDWVTSDPNGLKMLNTRGLEPMLVESLRTLKTENDALRAQSSKLEERVKALEARRSVSAASLGGPLGFVGLGLMAGALVLSRRRRPTA